MNAAAGAVLATLLTASALHAQDWRDNPVSPPLVAVRPAFLVPPGAAAPTADQRARLLRHLRIARDRYTELLGARDSFTLDTTLLVMPLAHPLAFYRGRPEQGVAEMTSEVLDRLQVSRFACPWILVLLVVNPDDDFPLGVGRPFNGGINTGGGIVAMATYDLDRVPFFQSTLQHELGHAFGLPHVDVYGRDMETDSSLMSYKPAHHTNFFGPAAEAGVLLATDRRGLSKNRRVFPHLVPDTALGDIHLGPMELPGHPSSAIVVTTPSGELYGSRAGNVVRGEILPSAGPGITFDQTRMWHSDSSSAGWVSLDLEFPVRVTLSRIGLYTQHSGMYHAARRARIHLVAGENISLVLADSTLAGPDAEVSFVESSGRHWRIDLLAADRGQVTVRGLRFWSGSEELVWGRW